MPTDVPGMDLLPSNIDLSAAEVQLVHEVAREQTLQRVLQDAINEYDVILIDCQPSLGLLTVNALTASHGVIVPLECEYFALRGVALLKTTIDKVKERLNPRLQIDGVLGTMYDGRTLHGREVMAAAGRGLGRRRLPHRDPPDREVLRLDGRRRADHDVRQRLRGRRGLPHPRQGGAGPVPRRVNVPAADDLFRPTAVPAAGARPTTPPGRRARARRAGEAAEQEPTSHRRARRAGGSSTTRR